MSNTANFLDPTKVRSLLVCLIAPLAIGASGGGFAVRAIVFPTVSAQFVRAKPDRGPASTSSSATAQTSNQLLGELFLAENLEALKHSFFFRGF
ncbi:MAG: hypothetical protein AAB425_12420, partial [Bdellovibrionota bacterium]